MLHEIRSTRQLKFLANPSYGTSAGLTDATGFVGAGWGGKAGFTLGAFPNAAIGSFAALCAAAGTNAG